MINTEKKKEHWENIYKDLKHLDNYCKIELRGIEDDASIYYHPTFHIDKDVYVRSQADVGSNKTAKIYALNFYIDGESVEIYEDLLTPVILGYHTNKDIVMLALNTLKKVKTHVSTLNNYTTDYIHNILMGNSIKEITTAFINELKTTEQLISFMQSNKK